MMGEFFLKIRTALLLKKVHAFAPKGFSMCVRIKIDWLLKKMLRCAALQIDIKTSKKAYG